MSDVASKNGIAAGRWLRNLERRIPVARAGVDPEGAHQMRVAIARLRVWLALGGWHVLDDDLRWLRGGIAQIRDLDVQLQHKPPPSWAATLRRRHERAQRGLLATLDDDRLPSLLLALSCVPPVPAGRARRRLPKLARRALRCGRAVKRDGNDLEALHRLRCVVRRLRFALEWLDVDTTDLVKVQDALGDACDLSVALVELGRRRGTHIRRYGAKLASNLHRAERDARFAFGHVRAQLEELASCSSS